MVSRRLFRRPDFFLPPKKALPLGAPVNETVVGLSGVGASSSVGTLAGVAALAVTSVLGTGTPGDFAPAFAAPISTTAATGAAGTLGRQYVAPCAGTLGVFDPKYCDDPTTAGRVHRLVSYVDIDYIGNPIPPNTYASWWMVSQALSVSDDYGATWGTATPVNSAVDHDGDYLVQNEVGGIVYDAGEAVAAEKWKMVFMRTVFDKTLSPGWLDIAKSSIMMRTAPSASGPWSDPITLLAGSSYDALNAHNPGTAEFTDAGALIVGEPGIVAHPTSGFYLAYTGITGVDSTGYIKLCRIHKVAGTLTKTDLGNPMDWTNDVAYFQALNSAFPTAFPSWGATARFDAADLVAAKNGGYWLLVTPVSSASLYLGMAGIRFTDLDTATLNRDGGNPVIEFFVDAGAYHHGAATHSIEGRASGVAVSLLDGGASPPFQIIQTGVNLPVYASITGQEMTCSVGSSIPALSAAFSGLLSNGSVGTLTADVSSLIQEPLTGVFTTGAVGAVAVSFAPALPGIESTGGTGFASPLLGFSLAGHEAAGSIGALARGATALALAGHEATGASGTLARGSTSFALTGAEATAGLGLLARGPASFALTGTESSAAAGTLTRGATSFTLSGWAATGTAGDLTPSAGTNIALAGVDSTGAVGSLTHLVSVALLGEEAVTALGSVSPSTGATITALTGESCTLSLGTLAPSIGTALAGSAAAPQVGSLSASIMATLAGVTADALEGLLRWLRSDSAFRTILLTAESRLRTIAAEDRQRTIEAQDRTRDVNSEDRTRGLS